MQMTVKDGKIHAKGLERCIGYVTNRGTKLVDSWDRLFGYKYRTIWRRSDGSTFSKPARYIDIMKDAPYG